MRKSKPRRPPTPAKGYSGRDHGPCGPWSHLHTMYRALSPAPAAEDLGALIPAAGAPHRGVDVTPGRSALPIGPVRCASAARDADLGEGSPEPPVFFGLLAPAFSRGSGLANRASPSPAPRTPALWKPGPRALEDSRGHDVAGLPVVRPRTPGRSEAPGLLLPQPLFPCGKRRPGRRQWRAFLGPGPPSSCPSSSPLVLLSGTASRDPTTSL